MLERPRLRRRCGGIKSDGPPALIPSSSGPVTYANDTFTDTNGTNLTTHTMNVGAGWTAALGTWTIQGNKCRCSTSGGANNVLWTDAGQANVVVSCDVSIIAAPGQVRIACNVTNLSNHWMGLAVGTFQEIHEVNGGGYTIRASMVSSVNKVNGGTYSVSLVPNGNNIKFYAPDELSYTVGGRHNASATGHGLVSYFGANQEFDNFLVTAIP